MSHVDEGALHAYLDGALDEYPAAEAVRIREHLDSCAECAERLEAERKIRTDAHAILGLAAPEVELPSFEDLRAYVERTRPKGGAISVHAYRMRLAASVVLALGTGWMLRGGLPGPQGPVADTAAESGATSASASGARVRAEPVASAATSGGGASSDALAERADLPTQTAVTRQEVGSARAAGAETRSLPEAEMRSAPEAEMRSAPEAEMRSAPEAEMLAALDATPVPAQKQAAPAVGAVSSDVMASAEAGAGVVADELELPEDDVLEEDVPLDFDQFVDRATTTVAFEEAIVTAGSATPTPASGEPMRDSAERDETSRSRERSAGPAVTSALEQNSFAARRAVAPDEAPTSEEPSMAVPGLEVVTVTSLGEGTASSGTHVVQRMEDGSTLDIYHLLPEVSLDIVPAAPTGANEVSRLTESGWIVLQGQHSVAELDELLQSLFPEG
jgi:hypothetical protein